MQLRKVGDSTSIKDKLNALSVKSLMNDTRLMGDVQTRLSKLMRRYSYVPNSNDLSTAVKRTSLKGRTFKERLVVAGNFQLLNTTPVTLDFSPIAGYKFNSKWSAGIGMNYRQTFSNNPTTSVKLSPSVFGVKVFASYDVAKGFFAYTEFDRSKIIHTTNEPGVSPLLVQ